MLNTTRLSILMQGYARNKDIQKFIPCGYYRANKIKKEIEAQVNKEGKLNPQYVCAKRLLKYVDLTAKEIEHYAELEQKKVETK